MVTLPFFDPHDNRLPILKDYSQTPFIINDNKAYVRNLLPVASF